MMRKHFINLILLFLFSTVFACSNKNDKKLHTSSISETTDGMVLLWRLDLLFNKLSGIEVVGVATIESVVSINESIKNTIKKITTPNQFKEIVEYYPFQKHDFAFALSNDAKLASFSWNTRMGVNENDIKTVVLLISEEKVAPTTFKDNSILYRDIFQIKTSKGVPLYLFHGYNKTSKNKCTYQIDAFWVHKTKLMEAYVFPLDNSSMISSCESRNMDFCSHLDFVLEKDGSLLFKPEKWKSGIAYKALIFDGVRFNYELLNVQSIIEKEDFKRDIDFNFLKGSELPSTIKEESESRTYIFEDGVQVTYENKRGTTKIFTPKNNEAWRLHFEVSGKVIGKHKNYLFFSKVGSKENWLLTIYDLDLGEIIISKNVAEVLIKQDRLLYAEFGRSQESLPPKSIDCHPNYLNPNGYYYTFYELQYTRQNLLVLSINQILCAHLE